MTNSVATKSNNAVGALGGLAANLANLKASMPAVGGDPYLRLQRDGAWVYGADDIGVEEGSQWAINLDSIKHGLVSWTDLKGQKNTIVGEMMVGAGEPLPKESDLPPSDFAYKKQYACVLACVSGEDKGTQVIYKVTSVGGLKAFDSIVADIMKQLSEDPEHPVPVVTLDVSSYKHPSYGTIYTPVIEVAQWASLEQTEVDEPEEVEEEVEEAPKKSRRRRA